jgi:hypothetical protein
MGFILQQLRQFTGIEWFLFTVGILVFCALVYAAFAIVDADQMSDEERKKIGLGPRGQGKGW